MKLFLLKVIKGLIFSPRSTFNQIKEGGISKKSIYLIFVIAMIVTLTKSFFVRWDKTFNFFDKQYLNDAIILLNHPLVIWIREYLLYFIGLLLLNKLSKLFTKEQCEKLPYILMAISGIGIVGHILFLPLNYLLQRDLLKILGLVFYLWNLILIFFAVRIASSLSRIKTSIIILISLIIFIVSPLGIWSFMTPYFLFIY